MNSQNKPLAASPPRQTSCLGHPRRPTARRCYVVIHWENPNLALDGGTGIQWAQMIAEKGVSHVLMGNCEPNAVRDFGQAGVGVIVGVAGPVRQAVERFKAGQFTNEQRGPRISPFGRLFRFIAWWFGFTGLYTAFAVCPFCGQQGCPVGLASAGTVGAFLALCVQDWKRLFVFMKQKLTKKNKQRQL